MRAATLLVICVSFHLAGAEDLLASDGQGALRQALFEAGLVSEHRAKLGRLEPGEISPRPRRWTRRPDCQFALIGPGRFNSVFEVGDGRVREVSPRGSARVSTRVGDLVARDGFWTWDERLPDWWGAEGPRAENFAVHFGAALAALDAELGVIRPADLELRRGHWGSRPLVFATRRAGPEGYLLFDVFGRRLIDPGEVDPARIHVGGYRVLPSLDGRLVFARDEQ